MAEHTPGAIVVLGVHCVLNSKVQERLLSGNRNRPCLLACGIWKGKDKSMGLRDGLEPVLEAVIEKKEAI